MTSQFRPLNDQILVRREASPHMSGLIHLPESAQLEAQGRGEVHQGVVVALGPGDWVFPECAYCACGLIGNDDQICWKCDGTGKGTARFPIDLKIGDRILFWFHEGAEHVIEGDKYIIVHEEQHVLGVLTE